MKKIKLVLTKCIYRISVMLFIPIDKLERWCMTRMKREIQTRKRTIGLATFESIVYTMWNLMAKFGLKIESKLN